MVSRLIIALDYKERQQALNLVEQLDPKTCSLKVGSEMFTAFGPLFVEQLINQGFKIFLDLKFHDIPNTVAQACQRAADLGVWMINVHASGGSQMMRAAREALDKYAKPPLLIAVTILTSADEQMLREIGILSSLNEQVKALALLSLQAGMDGVVCAASEVPLIKKNCGFNFLTITPGIRLENDDRQDQNRVVTPNEAIALGSDYMVIGRSITQNPKPQEVINYIQSIITSSD